MRYRRLGILAGTLVLTGGLLAGCGTASTASTTAATTSTTTTTSSAATQSSGQTSSSGSKGSAVTAASVDTSDLFSNRDLEQTADTSSAKTITLTSGQDVTISEEGVYVITGSAENTTIIVDAPDDAKVQLVLSGVTVTNDDFPVIYVKSADKVFVTTVSGTQNALSVTGEFTADGTTNTDAVIFCKSDLTLNGEGTLTVSSAQGNGISGKDEITITGGTYVINSKKDAIEAQDAINIADGDFTITTDKDGLHSEDSDDPTTGSVYIGGGTFVIDAGDDGIQATTNLTIDGGTFTIDAVEGLEGTFVTVNGGTISITASDDGINAAYSSTTSADGSALNGAKTQEEMTSPEMNGEMPEGMTPPEMNGEIPEGMTPPEMNGEIPEGMTPPEINGEMPEGMTPPEMNGEMPEGMTPSERNGETQEGWNGMQRPKGGRGGVCGQNGTMQGGGFGDMMDVQADAYLRIAGGDIYINAGGDALDANGYFYMEGGTVLADGPTGSGNGTIDAAIAAKVTGGTIIAVGSAGMAQSFGSDSTQYSINYTVANAVEAGTALTLTDETGKVVATASPAKTYQNVVISTPEIGNGTYTLTAGDQSESIVVESISTSAGSSLGSAGFGGRR